MKALLLAGGKGTRLRPLTNYIPKPMLPLMGKPLLERTIDTLKESGINEVIISTCYRSNKIRDILGNGDRLGIKITYVDEKMPLGTGGAIKYACRNLKDTFVVLNSDIVCDIDYRKLYRHHKNSGGDVTIAVTEVDDPTQYGVIEFGLDNSIKTFREKPKLNEITTKYINAGIYVFEPEVLNEIPEGRMVSIEKEIFPKLLAKGYVMTAFPNGSYWMDIGTPGKYMKIHNDIFDGDCSLFGQVINNKKADRFTVTVDNGAVIIGPVYIGNNVIIGEGSLVGPYTVIGEGTYIGRNCKVINSIVLENTGINHETKLVGCIIGNNVDIKEKMELVGNVCVESSHETVAI